MSPMPEDADGPIHRWTLPGRSGRRGGVFRGLYQHVLTAGDLKWAYAEKDYRLLGVNTSLRRQQESIRAAILLSRHDLGHLAVAFVRAALVVVFRRILGRGWETVRAGTRHFACPEAQILRLMLYRCGRQKRGRSSDRH